MVTLVSGLIGGIVATLGMTVFMMALGDDSPPPTATFWSKYVGDQGPDEYMMQGMVLHFLYGAIAGAVLVIVAPALGLGFGSLTAGLTWGLAYGVVLFLGAAVFWMKIVLAMDATPKMAGLFLFFHLVYGAIIGAWHGYGVLA